MQVMTGEQIATVLQHCRFRCQNEDELQRAIAIVLGDAKQEFEREVSLGPNNRIDFMVCGVGIEVKVDGSPCEAMRQLQRYAQVERVDELVLVTTRIQVGRLPSSVLGKPLHVVFIFGGFA